MMTNDMTKVMTLGGVTSSLGQLSGQLGMLPFTHAFTPLMGIDSQSYDVVSGLGAVDDTAAGTASGLMIYAGLLSTLGGILSGVHGYQRNRGDLGWTLGWTVLGALFPVPTVFYALGQGFGKKGKRR